MLPLFALLLGILKWKYPLCYPQWFTFALHFHTFSFFWIAGGGLFMALNQLRLFRIMMMIMMSIYMFFRLRKITEQSKVLTLFKVMVFFFFIRPRLL